jgi:zinc protease
VSAGRIWVEERHDLPLVHFQVVLPTGSLLDPVGKEGLTRLAARLMRRGTERQTTQAIEERIDALGADFSIETSANHVRLAGSVISRSLEPMLSLVGEMMQTPALSEHELTLLKRETLAALVELTDNDASLSSIHFRRALFAGHAFARPGVGTAPSIATITLDDVRTTYRDRLRVMQPIVGFAGDVTLAKAEELARKYLLHSERTVDARIKPQLPSVRQGRHLRLVDKPERTQTQIQIGRLGTHPHDADHIPLVVANAVFGGAFTARLMRAVRSERGWSYGASSRLAIGQVRDAWSMWTFPAASDAAACIALQLELMERWVNEGIDDSELSFAKSYLIKSYAFATDTADKRLEQKMEIELYDLPADYFSAYTQHVEAVTRAQANAAIQERLSPSSLVLSVVATEDDIGGSLRNLPGLTSYEAVAFDAD